MKRKWRLKGSLQDKYIIQYRIFLFWKTVKDEYEMIIRVDSIELGQTAVRSYKEEYDKIMEAIKQRKIDKLVVRKQKGQVIKL